MHAVLILSGGLDSTTLLYDLVARGDRVDALSVNYGQRHARELACAAALCAQLGVRHECVDLRALGRLLGGSALTDSSVAVPKGHYEEESMKTTVVPNRNMLLLAVAGAWAISLKADAVAYAAHGGDHAIYPDCRPEFAEALDRALGLADWHRIRLERPYVGLTKADLVRRGAALGVPYEKTWSCYEGGKLHCGRCGTCIERREAFDLAGVPDPTQYAADAPSVEQLRACGWRPGSS
jgi:7-cyano-7-deazaguanine synthase